MDPEDSKVAEFLENVFQDMRHTVAGAVNLSSPVRARARPYAKFKKQLNVMYRALDVMHKSGFETLFMFFPLNEPNMLKLMSSHCLAVWEECTEGIDVFLHLMYTCSFTYSLLAYCESNGQPNSLCLFTTLIMEKYPDLIKPEFEDAGGWEELDFFCSKSNLHFILDFINLCYNKQGKLFTNVAHGASCFFFGLNHDDTVNTLKENFEDFKNSVLTEYESELNNNLKYKFAVMLAFIKIELGLDHVAGVFNPPGPRKRLLYPTPVLFKYYIWDSMKNKIPDNIRRAFVEQEEKALVKQEYDYVNQEHDNVDQEHDYVDQEHDYVVQEHDCVVQEHDYVVQEHDYVAQEHDYAIQERNPTYRENLTSQNRTDCVGAEQVPTIDEAITILRECIEYLKLTSPIEEHVTNSGASSDKEEQSPDTEKQDPDIVEKDPGNEEKASGFEEQTPEESGLKTVEQISAVVKQYFANAKQFNTIEKEYAKAEQAFAAMKLVLDTKECAPDTKECAPDTKECAPDNKECAPDNSKVSQIDSREFRSSVAAKYDPDGKESLSDSE